MDGVRPYWVFLRAVPGRDVRDRVSEWMTEWFHHANKGDHPDVSLWAITGVQRRTVARRPSLPPGAAAAVSVTVWDATLPDRRGVDGIAFAALVRVAALLPSMDSETLTDLPGVIEPLRGVSEVVLTLDGGTAALVFAHRLAGCIAETWRANVIQVADEDPPEDFTPAPVDAISETVEMPPAEAEPPDVAVDAPPAASPHPEKDCHLPGTPHAQAKWRAYWRIIGPRALSEPHPTEKQLGLELTRALKRDKALSPHTVRYLLREGRVGHLGPPFPVATRPEDR